MSWWQALGIVLQLGFSLFQYLIGKEAEKAAAAKKIAEQFASFEKEGVVLLKDIVVAMGKTSWKPWDEIPVSSSNLLPLTDEQIEKGRELIKKLVDKRINK